MKIKNKLCLYKFKFAANFFMLDDQKSCLQQSNGTRMLMLSTIQQIFKNKKKMKTYKFQTF